MRSLRINHVLSERARGAPSWSLALSERKRLLRRFNVDSLVRRSCMTRSESGSRSIAEDRKELIKDLGRSQEKQHNTNRMYQCDFRGYQVSRARHCTMTHLQPNVVFVFLEYSGVSVRIVT